MPFLFCHALRRVSYPPPVDVGRVTPANLQEIYPNLACKGRSDLTHVTATLCADRRGKGLGNLRRRVRVLVSARNLSIYGQIYMLAMRHETVAASFRVQLGLELSQQ